MFFLLFRKDSLDLTRIIAFATISERINNLKLVERILNL